MLPLGKHHAAYIHRCDQRSGIPVTPAYYGELWEKGRFVVETDRMDSRQDVVDALATLVAERESA